MAEGTVKRAGPKYPVESVDTTLRLLELIQERQSITVSAAARQVGVAPSTAHRLLAMLQHYDLVDQDPVTKAYRRGPRLIEIGLSALHDLDIRGTARPYLERLVEKVGETAHLVGLLGAQAMFFDCVECGATVRATSRTGQRLPAHCTAAGKVQLASLPHDRVQELFPDEELGGLTAESVRTRSSLMHELERIRSAGYATNRCESEPDVHAVAVSIIDDAGALRGAVTVAGPPERMKLSVMRAIVPDLREATERIAAQLSTRPPVVTRVGGAVR